MEASASFKSPSFRTKTLTSWAERAWATAELEKGSSVWGEERPHWDLASNSQSLDEVGGPPCGAASMPFACSSVV